MAAYKQRFVVKSNRNSPVSTWNVIDRRTGTAVVANAFARETALYQASRLEIDALVAAGPTSPRQRGSR